MVQTTHKIWRFLNVCENILFSLLLLVDVTHTQRHSTSLIRLGHLLPLFFVEDSDSHPFQRWMGDLDGFNSVHHDCKGHLVQHFPNFSWVPFTEICNPTNPLAVCVRVFTLVCRFSVLAWVPLRRHSLQQGLCKGRLVWRVISADRSRGLRVWSREEGKEGGDLIHLIFWEDPLNLQPRGRKKGALIYRLPSPFGQEFPHRVLTPLYFQVAQASIPGYCIREAQGRKRDTQCGWNKAPSSYTYFKLAAPAMAGVEDGSEGERYT